MDATCGFARHGALVDGPALRLRTGVAAVPTTSQGTSLPVARRFLTS